MSHTITLSHTIATAPEHVYRAFTNRNLLQQWFCDAALIRPQVDGALLLAWNSIDYAVTGKFTVLEAPTQIAFSWHGSGEPASSLVTITLAPEGDGTRLTLVHSGLGEGDGWPYPASMYEQNWQEGLANLIYTLETGNDLRIQSKPMMGILPGALSPQQAEALGLPRPTGMLIDDVVEGFSAANAGLQKGDVVLTLGGKELGTFPQYIAAIAPFKAGDVAEVVYFRAGQQHTLQMTLVARPEPEFPDSPAAMAAAMQTDVDSVQADLDALIAGVDETLLARRPAPDEWSANEVLAHLIFTERYMHFTIYTAVTDSDPVAFPGNPDIQRAGILAVYTTGAALLAEFKRAQAETVAMMAALPEGFVDHRVGFVTVASLLQFTPHTRGHVQQIKDALAVVQSAVVEA